MIKEKSLYQREKCMLGMCNTCDMQKECEEESKENE